MTEEAQLQATIHKSQQNANAARNRAHALQGQASQLQREIDELERQLRELCSFERTALRDCSDVESQLYDRQRIIRSIGYLQNVAMAQQLVESITSIQIPQAKFLLSRARSTTTDEIRRGRHELERRIEDLRRRLRALQAQISQQQSLATRYDQSAQSASRHLRALQPSNT